MLGYSELSAPPASGGGGSAAWSLAGTWDWSSNVVNVDITDLGTYNELLLVCLNLTASSVSNRAVYFSTDNGTSFHSTSGDYTSWASTGVTSSRAAAAFTTGAGGSAALSISVHIFNNQEAIKYYRNSGDFTEAIFDASADPINALRIQVASGNLTGGKIRVYGR